MKNKIICLLSDGLDSPVAATLMIKKGFHPIFVSFLTSITELNQMQEKLINIGKKISSYTPDLLNLYLIPHNDNLNLIKKTCQRKLTCILCKRFMFRVAKKIAKIEKTNYILTGDILGEQASQTLDNLYSYNDLFRDYVKISPLIGFNKLDIINLNKTFSFYSISSQKINSCQHYPQYPETRAKISEVKNAENLLDYETLILKTIQNAQILKI
ncbi:MAG: hypothetical protein GF317_17815 [Candidatus Lokiarchaeota archaeon]|nr:hypothetical protein [Candidatus Lokiarchaeota archaeon]MBD3201370.1 hypothetical protein [Candidatus Lokiarchaeota archaeon]